MFKLQRRELLRALGYGAVLLVAPSGAACTAAVEPDQNGRGGRPLSPVRVRFLHGVASGDPLPHGVILWTRVTPEIVGSRAVVPVEWEVSLDPGFTAVLGSGSIDTSQERDFTVKLDLSGLEPATRYYYRFRVDDAESPIGRTRTAPEGAVDHLRFAVCSCASYAHGYFHGYRRMAERSELDAVLHLGDYIYEFGTGGYGWTRDYEPSWEAVTLDDYRTRYAQYRRDPDLQEVHRQHPFITVWDDHESANNAWRAGALNHDDSSEGPWALRKAASRQAYFEWLPIREQPHGGIWRQLRYGDLAELFMLDTRIYGRDLQVSRRLDLLREDPTRTLLGTEQEAWLSDGLSRSTSMWKLVGQQVIMGQLPPGNNMDAWDGYPSARERFFDMIEDNGVSNVVVLSGDSHTSWGMDLARNPYSGTRYDRATGRGALAVELTVPGITSPGLERKYAALGPLAVRTTPHIKYGNVWQRGYLVLDLTPERAEGSWFHFSDVTSPEDVEEEAGGVLSTRAGDAHLMAGDDRLG